MLRKTYYISSNEKVLDVNGAFIGANQEECITLILISAIKVLGLLKLEQEKKELMQSKPRRNSQRSHYVLS